MAHSEFAGLVPERLSLEVRRGRCVLFAGAGLSMQARRGDGTGLPAWGELLSAIRQRALASGIVLPNGVREAIDKGALLEVGQELQDCVSPGDLAAIIGSIFDEDKLLLSPAHLAVPKIRWRAILTTNYDALLEKSYLASETHPPHVLTFEDYIGRRRDPIRNGDFFLFKIHGDLKQPGSITIGTRSYQKLTHWNPGYRFLLESILNTFTVLFIGFGGTDPDVNHVLDALACRFRRREDRHYILMPRGKWDSLEKKRNELDRALETIEYDDRDGHSQVSSFLEELALHRTTTQRPLVNYSSRSLWGNALRSVIKELASNAIDSDTYHTAGWFDEARARLEMAEMLVLTTGTGRIEERILQSLAEELAVPVVSALCDTTANGESRASWSACISEAIRNARR